MSYSKTSKRIRVKFSLCCCWFLSGNPARERRTYSKSDQHDLYYPAHERVGGADIYDTRQEGRRYTYIHTHREGREREKEEEEEEVWQEHAEEQQ